MVFHLVLLGFIGWAGFSAHAAEAYEKQDCASLTAYPISREINEKLYKATVVGAPHYFATGEIDVTGALVISMCTRHYGENGEIVYSAMRAQNELDQMLSHFDGRFTRVRLIFTEIWLKDQVYLNDSLVALNQETGNGNSLACAIGSTFFGRELSKRKFSLYYCNGNGGSPGSYEFVEAEYLAPGAKKPAYDFPQDESEDY